MLNGCCAKDFFIGLNAVRTLSIVALLLVFSSSIFVMVSDVRAFNQFQTAGPAQDTTNESVVDCDYIEFVFKLALFVFFLSLMMSTPEEARSQTNPQASSGLSSTACLLLFRSSFSCSPKLAGPPHSSNASSPFWVPTLVSARWVFSNPCQYLISCWCFSECPIDRHIESARPFSPTTLTTLRSSLPFSSSPSAV